MSGANLELPWEEIRHTWETSEVGWKKLARDYGIASPNTLRRRAENEGWKRNYELIGRKTALADQVGDILAIAGKAEELIAGVPVRPRCVPDPATSHEERPVPVFAGVPMGPGSERARAIAMAQEIRPEDLLAQARQPDQAVIVANAVELALANVVQEMGLLLSRRVCAVLRPPTLGLSEDEVLSDQGEAEVTGNLQRLIRVNPERETVAGLVGVAAKTIQMGFDMQRKALTEPAAPVIQAQGESSQEAVRRQAMELISSLPPDVAASMRTWAGEVLAKRREAQISSNTAPTSSASTSPAKPHPR